MRQKIKDLLNAVEKQLEISKIASNESRKSANEASAGLVSSYSIAGDVEHAKNSANLILQKYEATKQLFEELQQNLYLDVSNIVQVPCYVKMYISGTHREFYLVKNPILVKGCNLISPESPIGKAVIGLRAGDPFLYKNGEQTFTGKILEIE